MGESIRKYIQSELLVFDFRKRGSPLCITKQPTLGAGAKTTQTRPKEMKEKIQKEEMPTTTDRQKTKKPRNHCAHLDFAPSS